MNLAMVTGVNGQDGSYLAELLQTKNYKVVGIVRDIRRAREKLKEYSIENIDLLEWDMESQNSINELIKTYQPVEFYNLAALSSGAHMFENPVLMAEINGMAPVKIMEAIKEFCPETRFCQASSSELFGEALQSPQTEETPFNPRSPYGAAKLYAHNMVKIYRNKYKLFAGSAILYNHESPRRGLNFVTRKIINSAVKIKLGRLDKLYLGNLDALRDWGFAPDYVRGMWMMLQAIESDDYVFATGITHSVEELVRTVLSMLDLKFDECVGFNEDLARPKESALLVGKSKKALDLLGWEPEKSFEELIYLMVDEELKLQG